MPRPVTMFTGQWADLSLADLLPKLKSLGYDGVELACWGDHFDVQAALNEDGYVEGRWELLKQHGMSCYSISSHLVGQAICDHIDERHQGILPPHVWGDGDPEGVRQRAAQEMIDTGKALRKFLDLKQNEAFNTPGYVADRLLELAFDPSSRPEAVVARLQPEKG